MKTKKPQALTFTLMPRDAYDETLEGLSFEEYLEKRDRDPLAERVSARMAPDDRNFNDKIQYLIEAVKEVSTKKKEILELWQICYKLIAVKEGLLHNFLDIDVYPLISLTVEAKFSKEENDSIDQGLRNAVEDAMERILTSDISFVDKIAQVNFWFQRHASFLIGLQLGHNVGEFTYYKRLTERYVSDFETLKSLSPRTYINYVSILQYLYRRLDTGYREKHRAYYLRKCLEQILVAKNAGLYEGYDELLRIYYTEKLRKNECVNWLFDKLTGYGEKPWKLVWLFLAVNVIFAMLFTLLPFEFKDAPADSVAKFFTFLYFNNTTMLTVGYGDIYPTGIGARIAVALLQIFGFAISGTAIALFLRRLLRF